MDDYIHTHIKALVIKKTFESISIDFRRAGCYKIIGQVELGSLKDIDIECDRYEQDERQVI